MMGGKWDSNEGRGGYRRICFDLKIFLSHNLLFQALNFDLGLGMKLIQKCFIILPFSQTTEEHTEDYWTNHFNHFLKPIIHDKTKIIVELSEPMRTGVLQDIIKNLIFSSVVIADITDLNPNVMWELGVR